MKITSLLITFVSLALTATASRGATSEQNNETVRLPAFTVESARQSPAERAIERNLAELRASAHVPLTVKPESPFAKAKTEPKHDAKMVPALVLARN